MTSQPFISRVRIGKIVFRLISGEEAKKGASTQIYKTKWREGEEGSTGGVQDLHMGAINSREVCLECRQNGNHCPGHFGYMDLTQHMYSSITMDYVIKLLRVVCWNCGNLLKKPPSSILQLPAQLRFQYIVKKTPKYTKCEMCGFEQPFLKKNKKEYIIQCVEEVKGSKTKKKVHREYKTYAENVAALLSSSFNADVMPYVGLDPTLNSFDSLLLRYFPVIPRCARPTSMPGAKRMENASTIVLKKAVEAVNKLNSAAVMSSQSLRMSNGAFANAIVVAMVDHTKVSNVYLLGKAGLTGINARPDSYMSRLRGKQGIMRSHINGKRIDDACRSVISPGASLGADCVGVPMDFAMGLVHKHIVNEYNYDMLMTCIKNGPHVYPGATMVQTRSGVLKSVELINADNFVLEKGSIVFTHLINGRNILVNRQPTLFKHGMIAAEIVVTPHNTIRLPPLVVKGPNADFDGDELNGYKPRTVETETEVAELMSASKAAISMGHGSCLVGPLQDDIVAHFRLTRKRTIVSREEFIYIMLDAKDRPPELPPPAGKKDGKPYWTGKQVFSFLLPPNLNYRKKVSQALLASPDFEQDEDEVVIVDGQLLKGVITSSDIGAGKTSGIVYILLKDFGEKAMLDFIYNIQMTAYNFNMMEGFTVSMLDTRLADESRKKIDSIIEKYQTEYNKYLKLLDDGILIPPPGVSTSTYFEELINNKVFTPMDAECLKIAMTNLPTYGNGFCCMVKSGAKGSEQNILQSCVYIGQQRITGNRLIPNYDGTRCDPSDTKYSMSLKSRGFIARHYAAGMDVHDFMSHGEAGRVGLVDTAQKTQQGGYAQRRIVKVAEGDIITNDHAARTALDNVVQYMFGGNGTSVEKTEPVPAAIMKIKDAAKLSEEYECTAAFVNDLAAKTKCDKQELAQLCKDEFNRIKTLRKLIFECNTHITIKTWDMMEKLHAGSNPARLVKMLKGQSPNKKAVHPIAYLKFVRTFFDDTLPRSFTMGDLAKHPRGDLYRNSVIATEALVLGELSLKKVIAQGLTQGDIDTIYGMLKGHFVRSIISPGEMIGIVSAESIGEAGTQLVLKTFHFAGMGGEKTNISQGIDAFTKLIYLKLVDEPQNSTMTIYLEKDVDHDRSIAEGIATKIKSLSLKDLDYEPIIVYAPDAAFQNKTDQAIFDRYMSRKVTKMFPTGDALNPFVIKVTFKRQMLVNESISVDSVAQMLMSTFSFMYIATAQPNEPAQTMLIMTTVMGIKSEMKKRKSDPDRDVWVLTNMFVKTLQSQLIRGIAGIIDPIVIERKEKSINDDGSIVERPIYVVRATGSNLSKVMCIDHVDQHRTFTDSPAQVHSIFGIEGLRQTLIQTFHAIYEASNASIDYRYFSFLADVMLRTGSLGGVHRAKLRTAHDAGPLLELSFENQSSKISEAAIFCHEDNMRSPSAAIALGQTFNGGTCFMDILFDNSPRGVTLEELEQITSV